MNHFKPEGSNLFSHFPEWYNISLGAGDKDLLLFQSMHCKVREGDLALFGMLMKMMEKGHSKFNFIKATIFFGVYMYGHT